jgi:hypothetical protein
MADVNPALVKNRAILVFQDFRRHEDLAMNGKGQIFQVFDHKLAIVVAV